MVLSRHSWFIKAICILLCIILLAFCFLAPKAEAVGELAALGSAALVIAAILVSLGILPEGSIENGFHSLVDEAVSAASDAGFVNNLGKIPLLVSGSQCFVAQSLIDWVNGWLHDNDVYESAASAGLLYLSGLTGTKTTSSPDYIDVIDFLVFLSNGTEFAEIATYILEHYSSAVSEYSFCQTAASVDTDYRYIWFEKFEPSVQLVSSSSCSFGYGLSNATTWDLQFSQYSDGTGRGVSMSSFTGLYLGSSYFANYYNFGSFTSASGLYVTDNIPAAGISVADTYTEWASEMLTADDIEYLPLYVPETLEQIPDLTQEAAQAGTVPSEGDITSGVQTISDPGYYSVNLTDVFPFCIPFDLIDFFKVLEAEREAPYFEIPMNFVPLGIEYTWVIDLSEWDSVASLLRTMELLAFCVGLILITRNMIRG